jgi:hypothetical protein
MASFQPIRDAAGGIVGLRPRDDNEPTVFGALLAETMAAVGAAEPSPEGETRAPRSMSIRQLAATGAILLLTALVMGALMGQPAAKAPAFLPTTAPLATAVPAVVQARAPMSLPTVAPVREIVAWAAPDGAVLGPVSAGSRPLARYGDAWVQVAHEGGAVWVRASDLPLDASQLPALPDLRPAPTALPAAPFIAADTDPVEPTAQRATNHSRPALDRTTPSSVPAQSVR